MKKLIKMYKELNADNLHLLHDVYSSDIQFIDPAHKIDGLDNLTNYFKSLYRNVSSIDFSFENIIKQDNSYYLQWDMSYSHKSFARGRTITVSGTTFLRLNDQGKIYYHRDYFDLGEMVYEHLPLLGRLLISIKRRLGQ